MIKQGRYCFALIGALLAISMACAYAQEPAVAPQETSAPDVRVEFFGPERGYSVGAQDVALLCVVRNVGGSELVANSLRLRCFAMNGLEYTAGETRPVLPALARQQAIAYRWRLRPAFSQAPMVAAVLLEQVATVSGPAADGGETRPALVAISPQARATLAVIPRLSSMPKASNVNIPAGGAPRAAGSSEDAYIANDRVQARIISAERRTPLLILSSREAAAWKTVATGVPLIELNAGEEGQLPWWETFRWKSTRTSGDKQNATLTLTGTIGTRWKAEYILEVRSNTSAIDGRLRLTPLRTLRLYRARLTRLLPAGEDASALKADGAPLAVFANEPVLPADTRLGATRIGGTTFGLSWASTPPLSGWNWKRLPLDDTNLLAVLGAQWEGPEAGTVVLPQSAIEIPFRLFALGPSDSVRDAQRFLSP